MSGEHSLSTDETSIVLAALRDMARASVAAEREHTVGELIRLCIEATRSERGALYLLDETRAVLSVVGTWPCNDELRRTMPSIDVQSTRTGHQMLEGIAGAFSVAETKAPPPVVAAGVKHWTTVPLRLRGRLVGALNIARNRDERYAARELRIADMLAEALVFHVENARLHANATRQLDETRMLSDIGRAVSASLELETILDTAVDSLTRMVDASTAVVLLFEEEGDTFLRGVACSNPALRDFMRSVRVDMGSTSLLTRAVAERRALAICDVAKATDVRRDLTDRLGQKSLLAVPLLTRDGAIGGVLVDDTRSARVWTPREIELTELVAHQVAAAIANARLFTEVKRRNEELARAHQQMVERERLAALGQFAATLAHEIRNPLGVLFNSVSNLGKLTRPDGEEAGVLAIMSEETRRLDRLVRDLLEFARPRAPELQVGPLGPVVAAAVDAATIALVPAPKSLVVEVAPNMPDVRVDPFMIRQALFNVILNAGQAAGPDGSITVRAHVYDEKLRIDVVDDGPGVAPEHAERIFEPFFTTKPMGTGLGLVIVKSIVDSHNGELRVSAGASGRGTTVAVVLPLRADENNS